MKNLTSKIFSILFNISKVCIAPICGVELYEIFRTKTPDSPRSNLIDALFWSTFAVYYLSAWYISRHNRKINAD